MNALVVPLLLIVWTSPFAAQVKPPRCGNTEVLGKSLKSYVFGEDSNEVFPWNVLIATKIRGNVKCLGSVIDTEQGYSNYSSFVVTAARCFNLKKKRAVVDLSTRRVYIAPSKFSPLSRQGVKREIESIWTFGRSHNASKLKEGLAILKLKHAMSPRVGIIPVCLAPSGALPTLASLCFSSQFEENKKRIVETVVTLYYRKRCLQSHNESMNPGSGICAYEQRQGGVLRLGGAMVCFNGNQAVLYGVFLKTISLMEYGTESEVDLYAETSTIHEALLKVHSPSRSIKSPSHPKQPTPSSSSENRRNRKSSSSSSTSSCSSSSSPIEVTPKRPVAPVKPPRRSKMSPKPPVLPPVDYEPVQPPLPKPDYPLSHKICDHRETGKPNNGSVDSTQHDHIVNDAGENVCLPTAPIVQVFDVSDTSPESGCSGIIYAKPRQPYSDTVLTFARCVWSRYKQKYRVYTGAAMATEYAAKYQRNIDSKSATVPVKFILTFPVYLRIGIGRSSSAGAAVVKLEHNISVMAYRKPYSLSLPSEFATPGMSCYVVGICSHRHVTRVPYKLLPQSECTRRLYYEYYPNFQYCAVGRENILLNPTGAPLICNSHGKWKQFAIYDQVANQANRTGIAEGNAIVLFMKLGEFESKMEQTESFASSSLYNVLNVPFFMG
ncbi:hypothetical protein M514_02061, partial [Trichuris suis]